MFRLDLILENIFIVVPILVLLSVGLSYVLRQKAKFAPQLLLLAIALLGILLGLITPLGLVGFIIGVLSLVVGVFSSIVVVILFRFLKPKESN
jgi:hypothetical protein